MADPFSFGGSWADAQFGPERARMALGPQRAVPSAPLDRWPQLPSSPNVVDERGNNQWVRALLDNAGLSAPSWEEIAHAIKHPMTRRPDPEDQWRNAPHSSTPLGREAGYDDVRPEELMQHVGMLKRLAPREINPIEMTRPIEWEHGR